MILIFLKKIAVIHHLKNVCKKIAVIYHLKSVCSIKSQPMVNLPLFWYESAKVVGYKRKSLWRYHKCQEWRTPINLQLTYRSSFKYMILPINLQLSRSLTQTHRSQSRLNRDRYVIKTCQPAKTHVQYWEGKESRVKCTCIHAYIIRIVMLHVLLIEIFRDRAMTMLHDDWRIQLYVQLRCLLDVDSCKYQNCDRHFMTIETEPSTQCVLNPFAIEFNCIKIMQFDHAQN